MAPSKIVVGQLVLYPDSKVNKAFWNGVRVPLRNFEFRLLVLLRPGSTQVIPVDLLKHSMAQHGFNSPIRYSVSKLRTTFRKVDPSFNEIISEWGVGYEWKTY
ncbi:hypothetical protein K2Q08_03265 [Patescibacteria group bacterium]|nr:hypothetical protein [Patescibacteria group bacterium]